MRSRKRRMVAACLAGIAVCLAVAGSAVAAAGTEQATRAFTARATDVCTDAGTALGRVADPSPGEDYLRWAREVRAVRDNELRRLAAIEPPAPVRRPFAKLQRALARRSEATQRVARLFARRTPARGLRAIQAGYDRQNAALQRFTARLSLPACMV